MKLTIGQFNESFPPAVDGVANTFINYCSILNKNNKSCTGIIPYYPGCENLDKYDFPIKHYKSYKVPYKNIYRVGFPKVDYSLNKEIKKINFDIVHSHTPFFVGAYAQKIAKARNIPHVSTFHSKYRDDFEEYIPSKSLIDFEIKRIIAHYNSCDDVWAVNNRTADTLKEYGYKKDIFVMENGCDFSSILPNKEENNYINKIFNLRQNQKLLLFVGQHIKQKNVFLIIDTIKELSKTDFDFKMLFVGEGTNKKEMINKVKEYKLEDKVDFSANILDRKLLEKLYRRGDLFFFPSLYDNAPIVIREAAACYTPSLLIAKSNSAEKIVNNSNGYLVNNEDSIELKNKIIEIFNDKELYKSVQIEANKSINISWESLLGKVQERYEFLVKNYEKKS